MSQDSTHDTAPPAEMQIAAAMELGVFDAHDNNIQVGRGQLLYS